MGAVRQPDTPWELSRWVNSAFHRSRSLVYARISSCTEGVMKSTGPLMLSSESAASQFLELYLQFWLDIGEHGDLEFLLSVTAPCYRYGVRSHC